MSKLLIVDDEIDILEFAKSFFKKRGINVFTASNGQTAVEIVQQENPDLMLLDVRMEGMSGLEVLRDLRGQQQQTKVIMVSGVEDQDVIKETESLGVTGFIHKPLILSELEQIVLKELDMGS